MKNAKSIIRLRDRSGRTRQLSVDEALAEGSRILSAGDYGNALLVLEKAVRAAPFSAPARHLLGAAQANAGNLKDASLNLRKAVEAQPNNAAYRTALAQALMQLNPSEAVPHFLTAILLGSTSLDAFINLGIILLDLRSDEDALKVCDLGLAACPEHFGILMNCCVALRRLGQFEEALACCRRQQELQPGDGGVWSNMGNILRELGRLSESAEALRQACLLAPENGTARGNLALTLLLNGYYREGFREYEWRWHLPSAKGRRPNLGRPLWDGTPLGGKRIILHHEQGLGDSIQMARYLPAVAKLGGQIALAVPNPLFRLMSWLPGQYDLIPPGLPLGAFATQCPLLSLPLMLETDRESIPPPVSFVIPAAIRETWVQRIASSKPKVALVWAGNPDHAGDRHRSLPLRLFLPLIDVDNVDFFSLQVGPSAQELQSEGLGNRIRDLWPFLTDFAETAAALSCMDLLISVDTAVAHLGGTLGIPVWTLVPFAPDWRWLTVRNDSPWYPSMRLSRQQIQGDWGTVIGEILTALQVWLLANALNHDKSTFRLL
jgi:Flp pilus assembly protein TadD